MKIPTVLSDEPIHAQPGSPSASPDDFGSAQGYSSLAAGTMSLARVGESVANAQKQRKRIDDVSWAGTAVAQEKNYISKWMEDPANNTKETFADDLSQLVRDRVQVYAQSNKSPEAQNMFRNEMLSFGSSRYESALQTSVKNRMTKSALEVDGQVGDVMEAYRHSLNTPGVDASKDMLDGVDTIHKHIDQMFGDNFPQLAQKLKEKSVEDAAYATMEHDPALARKVLDKSKTLDEHTRHTIIDHIEQAERSKNVAEIIAFRANVEDSIARAKAGTNQDKKTLTEYQSYYPRDQALAHKAIDDAQFDTYNRSNDIMKKIQSWNVDDQFSELSNLKKNIQTKQDEDVADIMQTRIHQNKTLQDRDPTGYLITYNPNVSGIAKQLNQVETDLQADPKNVALQTRARQFRTELGHIMLQYQGSPPPDGEGSMQWRPVAGNSMGEWVLGDDKKMYLGKATNDRHLMTADEAEAFAEKINKGTPKQMLDSISQVMARYEDPTLQNIAFNDMVTMPKAGRGIKQEYQLAFLNRSAHWVDEYLGAISQSDSIKKVDPEKKVDYEKELAKNPTWTAFTHSVLGDNFQRSDEVDGFRNGILTYAYARSLQKGEAAGKAVVASVGKLIGEELGFTGVNGQTICVTRQRKTPGQPYRTDDDISKIGQRLDWSLQFFDPRQIKMDDDYGRHLFPVLQSLGTEKAKLQNLRNGITQRGTYQMSPDGSSVSLYYQGDDGHAFQLRDKQNKAFTINLEDIERTDAFDLRTVSFTGMREAKHPEVKGIGEALGRGAFPGYMYKRSMTYPVGDLNATNWPYDPGFIRHEEVK